MFSTTSIILCLTFLNILVQVQCATELPASDNYGIIGTESAIRNTVNNLFSTLKIKDMQQRHKLKQYSTIHNFFVSITLQDHDNLKEIARLTKVDNIDNGTQVFITQLNEVLNEDNKSDEATDAVYVTILIEEFLNRLDHLKETYGLKNNTKFYDINEAIIKHFNENEKQLENATYLRRGNDSNDTLLNSTEFWQPSQSGRRIYGGESVKIERFPFMASVQFFKRFQCGGSIIKSDLIITSASCLQLAWNNRFFRENPAFLSVQVGSSFYDFGGENIPIMEIYFYPNYNPKNLRHNLAIMRMIRALLFGKEFERIKKIDIDRSPVPLPSNIDGIIIVGWGAKSLSNVNENARRNRLSYSVLDFYPLEECQEIYSKEYVTNRNFCAGFFSKGGGACNRDAGGPGISKGLLMGIISFGSPVCGARDAPTVFTKIGFYTDWIEEVMEKKSTMEKVQTTKKVRGIHTINLPPTLRIESSTHQIDPIEQEEEKPPEEHESLRMNDKTHSFKGFLATIFNSQESADYQDETQSENEKRVKKSKSKKALRSKPKSKKKRKAKNKNKPKKSKHEKHHSKKHSKRKEKKWKNRPKTKTTTEKYYSSDEFPEEKVGKVTKLIEDGYDSSDQIVTPSYKQHDDTDKVESSGQEQKMEKAIQSLVENLNLNDIMESDDTSPEEESARENLQRIVQTNPELLKSNLYLAEIAKKRGDNQKNAVHNNNQNANKKLESYDNDESSEDVADGDSDTDDTYEETEKNQANNNNIETDSNENNGSEDIGGRINRNNDSEDNDTDYDSDSDEEYEAMEIGGKTSQKKKASRNTTEKFLKMLAETDDIYELLLGGHASS